MPGTPLRKRSSRPPEGRAQIKIKSQSQSQSQSQSSCSFVLLSTERADATESARQPAERRCCGVGMAGRSPPSAAGHGWPVGACPMERRRREGTRSEAQGRMLGRGRFWFLLPPSKRDPPSGRKGDPASPPPTDMLPTTEPPNHRTTEPPNPVPCPGRPGAQRSASIDHELMR